MADFTVSSYGAYHGDYEGRYLYVDFCQTKNTAANTSSISWRLYSTGGSSTYYTVGPTYVYINGEQAYYCEQKSWKTYTFPAKTGNTSGNPVVVQHNTDGSKQITVSLTTAVYNEGTGTTSRTWTLSKIDRNSQIASIPSFNIEGSIVCNITKYVPSYTDTLTIKYGDTTIASFPNYTSGTAVTLTDSQILTAYQALGSQKSGDFTFVVTTYNGSTSVGSSSKVGTGTCVGNAWVQVNGVYRRALPWVNVNGTWTKTLSYTKADGSWERGI